MGVGAGVPEEFDQVAAAAAVEDGHEQRGVAVVVDRVDVGAVLQQGLGRLGGTLLSGEVERGETEPVSGVRLHPGGDEGRDRTVVILHGGVVQRRATLPVNGHGFSYLWPLFELRSSIW